PASVGSDFGPDRGKRIIIGRRQLKRLGFTGRGELVGAAGKMVGGSFQQFHRGLLWRQPLRALYSKGGNARVVGAVLQESKMTAEDCPVERIPGENFRVQLCAILGSSELMKQIGSLGGDLQVVGSLGVCREEAHRRAAGILQRAQVSLRRLAPA